MSFIHHCGTERIINLTVCANNTEPAPLHETQFELVAELYLIRLARKPHSLICILYSLRGLLSISRSVGRMSLRKTRKSEQVKEIVCINYPNCCHPRHCPFISCKFLVKMNRIYLNLDFKKAQKHQTHCINSSLNCLMLVNYVQPISTFQMKLLRFPWTYAILILTLLQEEKLFWHRV